MIYYTVFQNGKGAYNFCIFVHACIHWLTCANQFQSMAGNVVQYLAITCLACTFSVVLSISFLLVIPR